jgi:hypothetical protein
MRQAELLIPVLARFRGCGSRSFSPTLRPNDAEERPQHLIIFNAIGNLCLSALHHSSRNPRCLFHQNGFGTVMQRLDVELAA